MKNRQLIKAVFSAAIFLVFFLFSGTPVLEAESESFTFVFMTDVHLMPEMEAVEGFEKAIKEINRINPAFVISGGDQIDDAIEQNYERADLLFNLYTNGIKKINVPVYNVLGNHDIFGVFAGDGVKKDHPLLGKKMFTSRLNKKYYSFDLKGWKFIIIDSIKLKKDNSYIGEIDQEQINWLKELLKTTDKKTPLVIATHVPFFTIMPQLDKRFNYKKFTINNSLDVLELFKDHNLKFVLQGHVHNYENIYSRGIWFISGGAVCAGWWEGPLHGMEEGFVEFTITGEDFTWKYIDYGWEVPGKKDN
ncbi:MAG: metallophosphoesterase [Acidobacteriota bacterium]